jgi:Ca-activated chloride channel family protein
MDAIPSALGCAWRLTIRIRKNPNRIPDRLLFRARSPTPKEFVMRRLLVLAAFALAVLTSPTRASGLLIPKDKEVPPLAMLNHLVDVSIDDQVAITTIEQTFRNHTDRRLEATYVFPVPKGASVRKFSMWVNGEEQRGELVEADHARKIYTDIVSRTKDPGLLEHMGTDVLKLRVFPILPKSDQKVKISYTSVAQADNGVIEYRYPFKTDGKAASTLEKFAMTVKLRSQHSLQNIYSPSHSITTRRPNDHEAIVGFEKNEAVLDRDFQLFYQTNDKDVGLTTILHRPNSSQPGYFSLLVSPRAELSKSQQVARDMIFVLDTSGSMRGRRLAQAKEALQYCLKNLDPRDRFNMIEFATAINTYQDRLQDATPDNLAQGKKWVDRIEATGGTAIDGAMQKAFDLSPNDMARPYVIVFFTDGRPTVGETNSDVILAHVAKRNNSNTRIFTFGVGDDVNASMLDTMAEQSRGISTYVRETENIEAKVSGLYAKISNPVLSNLKIAVQGGDVQLKDIQPQQLPDLFSGSQLVLFGRYEGKGHAALKLTGNVGSETKEFVYELNFAEKTGDDKAFVEDLWARRKVGFLLDQIRLNGSKQELVDEVVTLAKRYGITTPYTSYLVVPDGAPQQRAAGGAGGGFGGPGVAGRPNVRFHLSGVGAAVPTPSTPTALDRGDGKLRTVEEAAKQLQGVAGEPAGKGRAEQLNKDIAKAEKEITAASEKADSAKDKDALAQAKRSLGEMKSYYALQNQAESELRRGAFRNTQEGTLGVNLSLNNTQLRNQSQTTQTATRWLGNRNALEVGGIWIDEAYRADMKSLTVKAQSAAYFRMLERRPELRKVFAIGNHLVWVSPSRTALIVDCETGSEELSDAAIDGLFVVAEPTKK